MGKLRGLLKIIPKNNYWITKQDRSCQNISYTGVKLVYKYTQPDILRCTIIAVSVRTINSEDNTKQLSLTGCTHKDEMLYIKTTKM